MEMTDVSNKKREWKKKERHVSYTDLKRRLALANTSLGSSDSKRCYFDWKINTFTWWVFGGFAQGFVSANGNYKLSLCFPVRILCKSC